MLSTSQALRQWDIATSLLSQIKVHAAAHPGQPVPARLRSQSSTTISALEAEVASPQATWKKLLQKKVPRKWLAACSGLIPTHPAHALNMAAMHLAMAVLATSADKSSSCSRQMAAQLWEQVQQSDILQQLPGLLSSTVTTLQTQLTGEPEPPSSGEKKDTQDILTGVLSMMHAVVQVQPAYYSTHTAQQQCLAPVMQLALMTLQNVSKSLAHDGQQKWMEHLLYTTGEVGVAAAAAGVEDFALVVESTSQTELEGVTDADTCSASSSNCGASNTARASTSSVAAPGVAATSSAGGAARRADAMTAAVGVLRVEQSVQWSCLAGLIPMLVQHVQHMHLTNGEPATGSSAEQPLPARRQHGNKRRENQEGPATLEGGSGMQWLPAVLAPSLPAAYGDVLEHLGCSREVGLWVAQLFFKLKDRDKRGLFWLYRGCLAVLNYQVVVSVQRRQCLADTAVHPQLATLHLSMSAAVLQWLLGAPFERLFGTIPGNTVDMLTCSLAAFTTALQSSEFGHVLARHHYRQVQQRDVQEDEQSGGMQQSAIEYHSKLVAVNLSIAELAMCVLQELLLFGRGLPNGGPSVVLRTLGAASSGNGSALLQACQDIMLVFAFALREAAVSKEYLAGMEQQLGVSGAGPGVLQLPVQPAVWCKLLQDYVRFSSSAVAAYLGSIATSQLKTTLKSLGVLFNGLPQTSNSSNVQLGTSCPLFASTVAAGDASSTDALQLYGIFCSLLKVCCSTAPALATVLAGGGGGGDGGGGDGSVIRGVYTSSFWLVSRMLRGPSTGRADSGSNCAALLPWMVLLGRCFLTCALLVQQCHAELVAAGPDGSVSLSSSLAASASGSTDSRVYANDLDFILHLLQSDLAFVVTWLQAADTTQQLTALGYQPQDLHDQLMEGLALITNILDNECRDHTVLAAIQAQLQAAGMVLATFAIPHACNNPC